MGPNNRVVGCSSSKETLDNLQQLDVNGGGLNAPVLNKLVRGRPPPLYIMGGFRQSAALIYGPLSAPGHYVLFDIDISFGNARLLKCNTYIWRK